VEPIHDRMPVILPAEVWDGWLDRSLTDPDEVAGILRPVGTETMSMHAVSTLVNKVANNVPELVDPLKTGAVDQ